MSKKRNRKAQPRPLPEASSLLVRYRTVPVVTDFRTVEDRRNYHPEALKPVRTIKGTRPFLTVTNPPLRNEKRPRSQSTVPWGVSFQAPRKVIVCVRRQQRREVLFAINRIRPGRGKGKRRNEWSNVNCNK